MLGKIFVSIAALASLVVFSSSEVSAQTPCGACVEKSCEYELMMCDIHECRSILSCLTACKAATGSDDYHATLCVNQCADKRTEASVNSASTFLFCVAKKCSKACK